MYYCTPSSYYPLPEGLRRGWGLVNRPPRYQPNISPPFSSSEGESRRLVRVTNDTPQSRIIGVISISREYSRGEVEGIELQPNESYSLFAAPILNQTSVTVWVDENPSRRCKLDVPVGTDVSILQIITDMRNCWEER